MPLDLNSGRGSMQSMPNDNKPLGQILIEQNIISPELLNEALNLQKKEKDKYLGEILIEIGVPQEKINKVLDSFNKRKPLSEVLLDLKILTPEQLEEVLKRQKNLPKTMGRKPLGVLLVEMGYSTYHTYMNALSKYFNMAIISLENFSADPSLQKVVGEGYAHKHRIVVLENNEKKIKLALAEPTQGLIDELQRLFSPRKVIEFYLAHPLDVDFSLRKVSDPYSINLYR